MMSTFFSELKILESSLVLVTLYVRNLDMLKCLLWYGIVWSSFNLIAFPMTLSREKVWSRVRDCRSFFGQSGSKYKVWILRDHWCTVYCNSGSCCCNNNLYCSFGNVCIDFCQRLDEMVFFLFNCLYSMQIIGKSQRAQS